MRYDCRNSASLLVLNRGRKRAPNLRFVDRFIAGLCTLFLRLAHIVRSAIILKPSTLLHIHCLLRKRKYRLLFSSEHRNRPGPKGPKKDLIDTILIDLNAERERSAGQYGDSPTWDCAASWHKDLVRRILSVHYRPQPDSAVLPGSPSSATLRTVCGAAIYSDVNQQP
jgi:putative transposase